MGSKTTTKGFTITSRWFGILLEHDMGDYIHVSDACDDYGRGHSRTGYTYPLEEVPPSKDIDVIERAVERILEEHRETLEKLGDE